MIQNIETMSSDELLKLQKKISEELQRRNGVIKITLEYNTYKGTGKCWVAEIDENGKILRFVDALAVNKDRYNGSKIFELREGVRYRINEVGTKSCDDRYDCIVSGKEIKKI